MKNSKKTKQNLGADEKMTLLGYYNALPPRRFPKTEFVEDVAERCKVDVASVRNWIMGRNKPKEDWQLAILVEITGISADRLWQE